MDDVLQGIWKFLYDLLYNMYIPVMIIWLFIATVRMTRSNILGIVLAGILTGAFITAISTSSYKKVFDFAVFGLVPVSILLIISGVYHEQYKRKLANTDPVYEKIKAKIQKEVEAEKIKLHEKRERE